MISFTKLLCNAKIPQDFRFSNKTRPTVVIWNMTRRCNLKCMHCYIQAEDRPFKEELTTEEAKFFLRDLAENKVPVIIFSGGEPLLRPDFYELSCYANDLGLKVAVSTNGTLITKDVAEKMLASGISYVGINLDGMPLTHDKLRGIDKSFEKAMMGIKMAKETGINVGVRFAITKYNYADLPNVLEIVKREDIQRFSIFRLVYSGRGKNIKDIDLTKSQGRKVVEFLINKTCEFYNNGFNIEILSADNYADGIWIYNYFKANPEKQEMIKKLLAIQGGCSAGDRVASVDNLGNVHPCQFWSHLSLGNIRKRKFSEIWHDSSNKFLQMMRDKSLYLKGKCAKCKLNYLCYGCRVRAEVAYRDFWQEDPICYLSLEEIS